MLSYRSQEHDYRHNPAACETVSCVSMSLLLAEYWLQIVFQQLQAGVRRGMKLTAISDPIRREEVWELQVSQQRLNRTYNISASLHTTLCCLLDVRQSHQESIHSTPAAVGIAGGLVVSLPTLSLII